MATGAALSLLLLLLLLDLPFSGGFSRLGTSGGPAAAVVAAPTAFPRLSAVAAWPEEMPDGGEIRSQEALAEISSRRRVLLRGIALWAAGSTYGPRAGASAYMVQKEEPDEKRIYAEAQKGKGPLRVLWVGSGDMKGVFKDVYFRSGTDVVALDLLKPSAADLSAATTYAAEHGYRFSFEQGDATNLKFADGSFDVVMSSQFLCQDFDPEVVVSEIRRVLRPGGRFGFYEDKVDIDKVIVDKVFGERSVIRVQYNPAMINIMAGVVRKV